MLLSLLAAHLATAAAPDAVVLPTQGVQGTVSVALAPADIRARLADPVWVRTVSGTTTTVTVKSREGSCVVSDYVSPAGFMTVKYTVRQCPTAQGVKSTLVASGDFSTYESEWIVTPDGAGSLLTYRVHVTPSLPLPVSLITGTMRKDVLAMMTSFATTLGPPR